MRLTLVPLLVLGALAASVAGACAARAGIPPLYVDRVLGNGMRVTLLPDSSLPIVSTRLWYHVGAANEAPNTRGFAHLFEHLMFGGTTTQPRGAWEAHHHRLGGGRTPPPTSTRRATSRTSRPPASTPC